MIDSYLTYGTRMFMKKNTVIYTQGTIGDGFYIVVEGKVKISMNVFGNKERMLEIISNGQVLGEQSMDQNAYFSSASTLEDSVLYHFEQDKFQALILKDKTVRDLFYSSMIHKLKTLSEIIQLDAFSAEQQLANSLLEISRKYSSYEIPLNQQQLSTYTGLTRITIYKIMKEWRTSNLLTNTKGKIVIKNPEVLQTYISAM